MGNINKMTRYVVMQNLRENQGVELRKPDKYTAEHESRSGLDKTAEVSNGENKPKIFDEDTAKDWVRNMWNEDGTKGAHWEMAQIEKLMSQRGIQYDAPTIYAVMNSLYSDYCKVLKKYGVTSPEAYLDLALAWVNDTDAVKNKPLKYFEDIVRH